MHPFPDPPLVTIVDLSAGASAPTLDSARAVLRLEDTNTPGDVIDLLILGVFESGVQPYARTSEITRTRPDAALHPAGARVARLSVEENERETRLYTGAGWTLRVVRWRSGSSDLTVTAVSEALAERVIQDATRDAAIPEPPAEEAVSFGFWYTVGNSFRRRQRPISAAPWDGIRRNYSTDAAAVLDRLMAVTPQDVRGRLLLLYGPPGTGKTTVLRTLAREWNGWCQVDCVLDPERLFADPGYLMEVAVGVEQSGGSDAARWRLLLLEDCDELIGGTAKSAAGQALSRLLNLTDGILGQGRDVLVAITTNEDLSRLHPAVTRPGRCLARVELGPLPYDQACDWLGRRDDIGSGGATLAELYALRDGSEPVVLAAAPPPPPGMYL